VGIIVKVKREDGLAVKTGDGLGVEIGDVPVPVAVAVAVAVALLRRWILEIVYCAGMIDKDVQKSGLVPHVIPSLHVISRPQWYLR